MRENLYKLIPKRSKNVFRYKRIIDGRISMGKIKVSTEKIIAIMIFE